MPPMNAIHFLGKQNWRHVMDKPPMKTYLLLRNEIISQIFVNLALFSNKHIKFTDFSWVLASTS